MAIEVLNRLQKDGCTRFFLKSIAKGEEFHKSWIIICIKIWQFQGLVRRFPSKLHVHRTNFDSNYDQFCNRSKKKKDKIFGVKKNLFFQREVERKIEIGGVFCCVLLLCCLKASLFCLLHTGSENEAQVPSFYIASPFSL